jgi:hypothetical protein
MFGFAGFLFFLLPTELMGAVELCCAVIWDRGAPNVKKKTYMAAELWGKKNRGRPF